MLLLTLGGFIPGVNSDLALTLSHSFIYSHYLGLAIFALHVCGDLGHIKARLVNILYLALE